MIKPNINFGDKINKECATSDCPMYPHIVALSNLGGFSGIVKCPATFCSKMRKGTLTCSKCKVVVSVYEGFIVNGEYFCYECAEKDGDSVKELDEVKEELPEEIEPVEEIDKKDRIAKLKKVSDKAVQNKMAILKKRLEEKSSKFVFDDYIDFKDKSDELRIFNPINANHLPLVWNFKYIQRQSPETLYQEVLEFFKSFFQRFEEKTCTGCEYEATVKMSMFCTDCVRNDASGAFVKEDRHIEK